MSDENKRKSIILTFIGALTLLFVVVGGTFAYFQIVNTDEGETTSTLTGETEGLTKYGTPTLTQGTSNLHINLKASDMGYSKKRTPYWATNVKDKDYETDKQQYVISTAKISGAESEDTELSCTSELTIKASGTILEDTNPLVEEDGYVYLGSKNGGSNKVSINPTQIDLKQIIDKSLNDGVGYQTEISYTIKGNTSIDITVDINIINRDANQNSLAGKSINFTITNKNISCSVKGPKGKAYMKKLITMFDPVGEGEVEVPLFSHDYGDTFGSAITESFVDYIPSDLKDEKIVEYIDVSDTEMGTPEGSVIAWIEETEEHNGEYNLYIGSESEIYAKSLKWSCSIDSLKEINLDNLNTSETTDMSSMFEGYQGEKLDLSSFDTSRVINMYQMFRNVNTNITFPQGFGSVATDMSGMFWNYTGTTLDLSNFDTSQITNMSDMFNSCTNLTTLDLSNFKFDNVLSYYNMFGSEYDYSGDHYVPSNIHIIVKKGQEEFIRNRMNDAYPEGHSANIETVD